MQTPQIHSWHHKLTIVKLNLNIIDYRFEFQVEGIEWMYENYILKRGCILADDMGLGKTVQVSVLISAL